MDFGELRSDGRSPGRVGAGAAALLTKAAIAISLWETVQRGRDFTKAALKGPFIHLATCQQALGTCSVLGPIWGAGDTSPFLLSFLLLCRPVFSFCSFLLGSLTPA